jgi:hypothetical protein
MRPIIIDPRNPPPPGPFELEERRQQALDQELIVITDLAQAVAVLRSRSQVKADRLEPEIRRLLAGYR